MRRGRGVIEAWCDEFEGTLRIHDTAIPISTEQAFHILCTSHPPHVAWTSTSAGLTLSPYSSSSLMSAGVTTNA